MSRQIGPSLPPGFSNQNQSDSDSDDSIGPSVTNRNKRDSIGPSLPPGFTSQNRSDSESDDLIGPAFGANQESDNCRGIGPTMPPQFRQKSVSETASTNQKPVVGPALPPDYKKTLPGPALPPDLHQSESSDDDNDVIGPMLSEINQSGTSVEDDFERRVLKMKEELESKNKPKKPQRETWMTELPSIDLTAQLGLGARQFRTNKAPAITEIDRDDWTTVGGETGTSSKATKRSADVDLYPEELAKDRKIAIDVKKFNETARAESLMQLHSKKLKKEELKEKDKDEKPERVPFDRERDLNTKKFDDVQRKAILKKAAKLDSRFSHGGKQYL